MEETRDTTEWEVYVGALIENRQNLGEDLRRQEEQLRLRELAIRRREIEKMIETLQLIAIQEHIPSLIKVTERAAKASSSSECDALKRDQLAYDVEEYRYEYEDRYAH